MRWRVSTHHARAVTNRLGHGRTSTAVTVAARVSSAQVSVTTLASSHTPAVPVASRVVSVRNRQIIPAAVRLPRTSASSQKYGLARWARAGDLAMVITRPALLVHTPGTGLAASGQR